MIYYPFSLELPFSNIKLKYREFTTEEQLILGKSHYSFQDPSDHYEFIYEIVKNLVSNKSNFERLDVFEYLLFLLKLRCISVGNQIELNTVIEEQTAKITIDINILLQNIYNVLANIYVKVKEDVGGITIAFPAANVYKEFLKLNPNDFQCIFESMSYFMQTVGKTNLENLSPDKRKIIFSKLPVSLVNTIQTKIFDILKELGNEEIFAMEIFKDFKLNLYNKSIYEVINLITSYDMKSIYRDIYTLSNLNPDYLKSLSPSERKIYISLFMEEKAQKNPNKQPMTPLEQMALDFQKQ